MKKNTGKSSILGLRASKLCVGFIDNFYAGKQKARRESINNRYTFFPIRTNSELGTQNFASPHLSVSLNFIVTPSYTLEITLHSI